MVLKLAKITRRHDPAALFLTAGTGNAQQWEKGYDESSNGTGALCAIMGSLKNNAVIFLNCINVFIEDIFCEF